jgi:hypothetical protein
MRIPREERARDFAGAAIKRRVAAAIARQLRFVGKYSCGILHNELNFEGN